MTNAVDRLLDQLDRSLKGESWHGPALQEVLAGIDPMTAVARPIRGGHTIAELVAHCTVWQDTVTRRLQGADVEPTDAEDFPRFDALDDAGWSALVDRLRAARRDLRAEVASWEDADLDDEPVRGRGTRYLLVHGVIQHDLYHAGQIALIRKAAVE